MIWIDSYKDNGEQEVVGRPQHQGTQPVRAEHAQTNAGALWRYVHQHRLQGWLNGYASFYPGKRIDDIEKSLGDIMNDLGDEDEK